MTYYKAPLRNIGSAGIAEKISDAITKGLRSHCELNTCLDTCMSSNQVCTLIQTPELGKISRNGFLGCYPQGGLL